MVSERREKEASLPTGRLCLGTRGNTGTVEDGPFCMVR